MEMMGNAVVGKGGEDEKKISIDRDGRCMDGACGTYGVGVISGG
jgi:hypothetical protein